MSFDDSQMRGAEQEEGSNVPTLSTLRRLQKDISDTAGTGLPGGELYVDSTTLLPNANQTGAASAPFKTIGQAIAAVAAGQTIHVAAGIYNEALVMRDVDGVAIVGDSVNNTIVTPPSGGAAFSWTAGATTGGSVKSFLLQNLTLGGTPLVGASIAVTGAAAVGGSSVFLGGEGFLLRNVIAGGNVGITQVGTVDIAQCELGPGATPATTTLASNGFNFVGAGLYGNVAINQLTGFPPPTGLTGTTNLATGVSAVNLTIVGSGGGIYNVAAARVSSVNVSSLSAGATFSAVGLFDSGAFTATNLADGAGLSVEFAQISGNVSIAKAAGGVARLPAILTASQIGGSIALASDLIDLDLRGSTYAESTLSVTGTSTMRQTRWTLRGVIPAVALTPVTFTIPRPAGANAYAVLPSYKGGVTPNSGSFSAETVTGFSHIESASTGTVDYVFFEEN
jgi:hypothetical protein